MKKIPVQKMDASYAGMLVLPEAENTWGTIEQIKPMPEPKDIPLDVALDSLGAHGVMIKNIQQTSSFSYDGVEFDLSMTILVDPKSGKETMDQLNNWFFSKAYKKW